MSVSGATRALLDAAGMPYDVEGDGVLRLSFLDGDTGLGWTCIAYCLDAEDLLVFFSVAPDDVPPARRSDMAEYLVRANYGLQIGCLEMDFADGEVRLRTSVAVGDARPLETLLRPVIAANLDLMRRYLPGVLRVAAGEATPAEALTAAEAREIGPLPL